MSELSTVAIKDGHRGHPHHHNAQDLRNPTGSGNLDAERADRISRLAGLERMTAVRQSSSASLPPGASASNPQGYFDAPIPPNYARERSTVGSASATGSVAGGTQHSGDYDMTDKMSEDLETSSNGGFSDEGNASLVGFGEGASSTVSGPISSMQRQGGQYQSKGNPVPLYMREGAPQLGAGALSPGGKDVRVYEGMNYERDVSDTQTPQS